MFIDTYRSIKTRRAVEEERVACVTRPAATASLFARATFVRRAPRAGGTTADGRASGIIQTRRVSPRRDVVETPPPHREDERRE